MRIDEMAEKVFLALLARDPLPAQRFTEIDARMRQLMTLSRHIALTWILECSNDEPFEALRTTAQREWDTRAVEVPEIQTPKKLSGAPVREDMFGAS